MADSLYEILVLENMRLRSEVRSSEAKHRKAQEERDAWKRAHGEAEALFNALSEQVSGAGGRVSLQGVPLRVKFESAPIGEASGPGPVSLAAELVREKGECTVLKGRLERASAERDEAREELDALRKSRAVKPLVSADEVLVSVRDHLDGLRWGLNAGRIFAGKAGD